MSDNLDNNYTEGPEGYFVESRTPSTAPRDRRERHGGRRVADAELVRARKRLIWTYATIGAMFATGALIIAVAYLD